MVKRARSQVSSEIVFFVRLAKAMSILHRGIARSVNVVWNNLIIIVYGLIIAWEGRTIGGLWLWSYPEPAIA